MPSRHSGDRRASALVEVVAPRARMRVDEAERRGLPLEIDEDARENRVLDDIGEIAGVEGVTVVHRARPLPCLRLQGPRLLAHGREMGKRAAGEEIPTCFQP